MSGEPTTRQGPHPVDVYVGGRVRLRRTFLGYSQEKLGRALGLTFQQIQKYERGLNRISSSKLYELSKFLEVPVAFFFEGLEEDEGVKSAGSPLGPPSASRQGHDDSGRASGAEPADVMARRESILLVSRFYNLPNDAVRREILNLMKAIAD